MTRWGSLKGTALYAGWLISKQLGYNPHGVYRGSFIGYYRMCRRLP